MKQKIVQEAREWLGTDFCHQGRTKKSFDSNGSCDCLGLVIEVSKALNLKTKHGVFFHLLDRQNYPSIPDSKELVSELDEYLTRVSTPEVGDLALLSFLGQPQHLAFIGELSSYFTLIHAYMPLGKVCEHILDQKWQRRIAAFYRFYF